MRGALADGWWLGNWEVREIDAPPRRLENTVNPGPANRHRTSRGVYPNPP